MSTLIQINPANLLVDTNIRADLSLDKAFLGSVKERGVIVPIVAMSTTDGVRVIAGHRRTAAAAVAASLTEVPVVLVDQIAENDHRTGLTDADRADAVHQLALLGVSAAQITKRTKLSRDTVDAAISLADREDKTTLLAQYPITVAAWIAEFDGDEHAQDRIQSAYRWKGEGGARHEVQRQRDEATHAVRLAQAAEVIATEYSCATRTQRFDWTERVAEALDTLGLDENDHASGCPGHVLVISEAYLAEPCDHHDHEDDEDCGEVEDCDPIYAEVDGLAWTATAYCTDWQAHGHTHPWKKKTTAAVEAVRTEDEQAAAADAAKAERRRVIAGNKAWAASHEVRAEFLEQLAQRKTAIPGGAVFALDSLQDTRDLIGVYGDRIDTTGMSAAQATNALVLWICRSRQVNAAADQGKSLWRGGSHHSVSIARFLRFLESVGYTLTAAEEAAAGGETYAIPTGVDAR